MKLISLKICNFRQFYGKSPTIELATNQERNTTVIHGNNGAGKTGLLNAFTWVLYEKFTAAFASTEQLVNKRAIAESQPGQPVECWAELIWEHDGKRYRAKRECRAYKGDTVEQTPSKLFMQIAAEDGSWGHPREHPEDIIGRILPESLHQYFFFDGERIEQIVRSDKRSEIAEATKKLLGVEILNRSINHLNQAKKNLEKDLEFIGDIETKKLLKEKDKFEQDREQIQKRQGEIAQELAHQQTLKQETINRLRQLGRAKELELRRQGLEAQQTLNRDNFKNSKEAIKKAISTRGYTVLLPDVSDEFKAIIEDLKQHGKLMTGIDRQFVYNLLTQQRCLCGSELFEGNYFYENVKAWLDKASIAAVEETAIRLSTQVDEIEQQSIIFSEEIDREQATIKDLREVISQIETQLDDIREQLRKDPSEEIRDLQQRLDEIEEKIRDLTLEEGENQQKIAQIKGEIEKLGKQVAKHEMNEAKQVVAQRRIAVTQDAIVRLTEVRSRLDQQFRLQLEKRIQEIFSEISFTPYIPQLSDKYELILEDNAIGQSTTVAASTGENQILSLSFIGGIIDRVREWSEKEVLMMPSSSTFPLVMDSPFGSLDQTYRRQIAKIIPRLANQLIVLVTKTQWREEVEEEIAEIVGKQYVLTYYSSKLDCEQDFIDLGASRYPLVKQSPNGFDYTKIIEVEYDF
ncbi:MAG TPA: AAA family ATPase [Oculatellaceae cyanobacterium]|jgi:DNA sulfur modification protein DndD